MILVQLVILLEIMAENGEQKVVIKTECPDVKTEVILIVCLFVKSSCMLLFIQLVYFFYKHLFRISAIVNKKVIIIGCKLL